MFFFSGKGAQPPPPRPTPLTPTVRRPLLTEILNMPPAVTLFILDT